MENEKQNPENHRNEQSADNSSGEDILNRIEKEANEEIHADHEESDVFKKLGLSKKDKLKKETAELKQKIEELNEKNLRLAAEFDNYKKRIHKERIELSRTAGIEIINALLPVLDDFNRAIKQIESSKDINSLKEGVKLIYQKLVTVLESRG